MVLAGGGWCEWRGGGGGGEGGGGVKEGGNLRELTEAPYAAWIICVSL